MRVEIRWGLEKGSLELPDRQAIAAHPATLSPGPQGAVSPSEMVRAALEKPFQYPPLQLALTPDDHIAIFVDEKLPHLVQLLTPILDQLRQAGVQPEAMTLLCQTPSTGQPWIDELPDDFQDVQVEVHDPVERKHLSYLATTKEGRRVYLNRTAVDADLLILLTGRTYDTQLGYGGAEGSLFPELSDEETRQQMRAHFHVEAPGAESWPMRKEAQQVAWLLGAPFFVQAILGADDTIAEVVAGSVDACKEGQYRLDARWKLEADRQADVVVAQVSGDPDRHTFLDLARAFACAARVVREQGKIVVLSDARPDLGRAGEILRTTEDPGAALKLLAEEKPADYEAGFLWCKAAQHAKLYLLSHLDEVTAEELFTTPLERAEQALRVIGDQSALFIADAHRALAVVRSES